MLYFDQPAAQSVQWGERGRIDPAGMQNDDGGFGARAAQGVCQRGGTLRVVGVGDEGDVGKGWGVGHWRRALPQTPRFTRGRCLEIKAPLMIRTSAACLPGRD